MIEFLSKPVGPMEAGFASLLLGLFASALVAIQMRHGFSRLLLRDESTARANGLRLNPRTIYVNAIIGLVGCTLIALVAFGCAALLFFDPPRMLFFPR